MLIFANANKKHPYGRITCIRFQSWAKTLSAKRLKTAVSTPCFVVKGIIIPKKRYVKPKF